jgi:plastocyanin
MNQKSNKTALWIIVTVLGILLVAGIAYAFTRPKTTTLSTMPAPDATTTQPSTEPSTDTSMTPETSATTITYTDNGFSPSSYTVKKGSTVTVTNNSKMDLQFSSDDHPTHTHDTELNMKTQKPGESVTFTVTKTGTQGFHDHLHPQYTGTLTITE